MIYLKYTDFNYKLEIFVKKCREGEKASWGTTVTTIAIKRKEHAALSTKIVDGKYFSKDHQNFVSWPLCLSLHSLIKSSIVEDDKATVRESVASRRKRFLSSITIAATV